MYMYMYIICDFLRLSMLDAETILYHSREDTLEHIKVHTCTYMYEVYDSVSNSTCCRHAGLLIYVQCTTRSP